MFDSHFKILNRRVGPGEPCLIIGEAGVNHFGDLEKGKDLVDMVTESGADVFKTQAFSTDQLISNSLASWKNRMRSKEVDLEFLQTLNERCDRQGVIFMCTAHDHVALNWLKKLDVVAHKIGSGEKENYDFFDCGSEVIDQERRFKKYKNRINCAFTSPQYCPVRLGKTYRQGRRLGS